MKPVAKNEKVHFKVNIGTVKDEYVDIFIYVNDRGNLVLKGVPGVHFDLLGEEFELSKIEDQ